MLKLMKRRELRPLTLLLLRAEQSVTGCDGAKPSSSSSSSAETVGQQSCFASRCAAGATEPSTRWLLLAELHAGCWQDEVSVR